MADHLGVNAHNVHGYIVGEHGDSSVRLWSGVSVGGIPLISYSNDTLTQLHRMVVDGAYEVIKLKGYTSWAVGYSLATLVKSMLRDQKRIYPVSVCAKGLYGIEEEVFLSLPAEVGRYGVMGVMDSALSDELQRQLQKSARMLADTQKQLNVN